MEVSEVIKERYSCRKFLNKEVDKELLFECIELGKQAPSSKNTQPWKICVVKGNPLKLLVDDLVKAAKEKQPFSPDYSFEPKKLPEIQQQRAKKCGHDLFKLKGVGRDDMIKRNAHMLENFEFFGAPVVIFAYLDKSIQGDCSKGMYLDAGLFIQNLWLSIRNSGLEACVLYSVLLYSPLIRKYTMIPENTEIICAMAVGYPDNEAVVTTFRTEKMELSEFVTYIED
ncbi:MAG: nitroreductase [Bacteroidales bacterium]|nr:nitroreductase [Bacteroidales bacterium]